MAWSFGALRGECPARSSGERCPRDHGGLEEAVEGIKPTMSPSMLKKHVKTLREAIEEARRVERTNPRKDKFRRVHLRLFYDSNPHHQ